ncbi:hypothetical protein HY338_02910, partial [Candidatus Gottesmanbacteria bacterium]|nr:hypothetical protein [Candidatus Gottesmanbacteria bacterium]
EEEDEQEKVKDISDQDVGQMGKMVKDLGGFMMLKTGRFNEFKNAYNTLTDSKLAESLLDLAHPEKLARVQSAVKVSRYELAKTGNKARGYTESRFLFWKSNRLTPDQLYRAGYSTMLAKQLHHRVDQTSSKYKIEGFINNFKGTDQENEALRKSLSKWRKEHPDKSLDEAIISESKRIKTSRGERFAKKEEEEVQKQLAAARSKAVEEHKAEAARTSDHIKYTLDTNNPAPAPAQFGRDLKEIQTGQIAPVKLAGGFAEIPSDLGDAIMGYDIPAKKIPTTTPTTPPSGPPPAVNTSKVSVPGISSLKGRLTAFLNKSAALQAAKVFMRNALAYSIKALRSVGLRSVAKSVLSFARNTMPFLFKTASRAAITAAGAAASLGSSLLAQAALEVLKKIPVIGSVAKVLDDALMGLVKGLAILIIGVPIAIIILILFAGPSLNTVPNYGVGNSMKISLKNPTQKYAWSDFERNFLTADLSWEDFEKNSLRLSVPLLSENK